MTSMISSYLPPFRARLALVGLLAIVLAAGCQTAVAPTADAAHPELVELEKVIPGIQLDIRYATPDNFTGKTVYPVARCFLVKGAALALGRVQAELQKQGYGLKVFDGYRPLSVQRAFWEILPDPRYVADPAKGSRHNRGYAVDLTLVDAAGRDVPMPTEYDDFTERAHRGYMDLPQEAIANRDRLERAMKRHGFIPFPTEWWHFDYRGYEGKPNLDVPLESL